MRHDRDWLCVHTYMHVSQALEHFVSNGFRERRRIRIASSNGGCRVEVRSSGKDGTAVIHMTAAEPPAGSADSGVSSQSARDAADTVPALG